MASLDWLVGKNTRDLQAETGNDQHVARIADLGVAPSALRWA